VKVIRPRGEFPTPGFRIVLPLLLAGGAALIVWLVVG
jgi:hypothetical protein